MTVYHIIGFLVSLNLVLLIIIFKKKKKQVIKVPPMKDGRTTRYEWIRLENDYPRRMFYTDTHKAGIQEVQIFTRNLSNYYANEQIRSMNTAWIEHGIEFQS